MKPEACCHGFSRLGARMYNSPTAVSAERSGVDGNGDRGGARRRNQSTLAVDLGHPSDAADLNRLPGNKAVRGADVDYCGSCLRNRSNRFSLVSRKSDETCSGLR